MNWTEAHLMGDLEAMEERAMEESVKLADAIFFTDGGSMRAGQPWPKTGRAAVKDDPVIEKIEISEDMPGLYNHLIRARVFVKGRVVFEAPVHNLEGVEYPLED